MSRMAPLVTMHPGYAPYAHFAPAVCALLQEDYEEALACVGRSLAMVTAGRHPTWPWMVNCQLRALLALGRFEETRALGLRYLEEATNERLLIMSHHAAIPLAMAEAELGQGEKAVERIDAAIAYREGLGVGGVNLGWAYEQRARVAICLRHAEGFVAAATRCAEEYGRGRGGSSLMGKYEALRSAPRQVGLITPSELAPAVAEGQMSVVPTTAHTVSMLGEGSFEERRTQALTLLINESGARSGILYRAAVGGLTAVATIATIDSVGALARDEADTLAQT